MLINHAGSGVRTDASDLPWKSSGGIQQEMPNPRPGRAVGRTTLRFSVLGRGGFLLGTRFPVSRDRPPRHSPGCTWRSSSRPLRSSTRRSEWPPTVTERDRSRFLVRKRNQRYGTDSESAAFGNRTRFTNRDLSIEGADLRRLGTPVNLRSRSGTLRNRLAWNAADWFQDTAIVIFGTKLRSLPLLEIYRVFHNMWELLPCWTVNKNVVKKIYMNA